MTRKGNIVHIDANFNNIFIGVMLILGIILFYTSWEIDSKLQEKGNCISTSLKTSNKIVLCIGLTLIVASLSFFTCSKVTDNNFNFSLEVYIGLVTILGFILVVLGSIISGSARDACEVSGTSIIWILGLLITACGIFYFNKKFEIIKI